MSTYNIALIGCGRIGFLLEEDPLRYSPCTHYGGLKKAGLKVTHACDIDTKRLKKFQELARVPNENCYIDYTTLLRNNKLDMVIIATWTETHSSIAIAAAHNGVKCIVLEKPLASNLKQAAEILLVCKKHGVHVIVSHERRYDNRYRKVKFLIEKEKIGNIISLYGTMHTHGYRGTSHPDEGGGPLLHDGTHLVDITRYLLGDINTVRGKFIRSSRKQGFEDLATAWLKSRGGVDIFLEAGGECSYFQFELTITGTKGKIVIGNGYERLYQSKPSKYYKGFCDLQEQKFPSYPKSKSFTILYKEARALLQGETDEIASSAADGYKALEIIHGIYLSSHKGGKELTIPISPGSVSLKKIFSLGKKNAVLSNEELL